MSDSTFQAPLNRRLKRLIDGLTYQAIKVNNNWMLPLGKDAAAGEAITVDGILGYATAAIVGGTDTIVEDTNWKPYGDGGALSALNSQLSNVGTIYVSGNSDDIISVPTGSNASPQTTTSEIAYLPAGRYLLYAKAMFCSMSETGSRQLVFWYTTSQGADQTIAFELPGVKDKYLTNTAVALVDVVSGGVSIGVKQSSGATMEVRTRLYALRLSA